MIQGGRLLPSAVAGAAYPATADEEVAVLPSGIAFGTAFYAAAHWIIGPLLWVKAP